MKNFEGNHSIPKDIQEILDHRDQLDQLLKEKFTQQVAVMFADLKGSTEYFETYGDIAGVAMINKYNSLLMPVIEEQGRVVEVIGDAIMACFDSPEAAVKTAIEMQKTLQVHNRQTVSRREEIHIRIGINYGPGILTEREEGILKVSGDVVNTAARVEAGGGKQTDQILISRAVYDPIQEWQEVTCKAHGFLDAKGKAQPLELYRVVWDPEQEEKETTRPDCPYPGMVPFSIGDAQFFYGRETEINQMVQHLRRQRFLLLIGPSGSGKSSLVFAGLLPQLQASSYFPKDFWLVRQMRPGSRPTRTLVQLLGDKSDVAAIQPEMIDRLLADHTPARRLLVVVDQFEEVFTQADREEGIRFIAALQGLAGLENCAQVLTMRADFYPELMNSDLWPLDTSQRLEVTPLRGEALRAAIQQPAAEVGVRLEWGLVERLLADAADEPGALPLLQETMVLLWEEMQRHVLSLSAYEKLSRDFASTSGKAAVSGLAVAMVLKGDATLAELSPAQQAIARRVFLRLIHFGVGRADTRRQQPVSALRAAGDDPNQFKRILEHLTANRLLTRSGEDESGLPVVDIAHESLITGWSRLRDWTNERREAEQVRRRLEAKAAEWVRLGRGSGGLLDESELPEAERWMAGSDAADLGYDATLPALVKASQQAIEANRQEKESARQRELAQAQALEKEQRQRLAEQARSTRRLQRLAIVLAGVLLVALSTAFLALNQSQKAQIYADKEVIARQNAEERRVEAEKARVEAERSAAAEAKARAEAERLRLVSISKSLVALAPRQMELYHDERGALLARQAYLFYHQTQTDALNQVDRSLRTVLDVPYFSVILRGHSSAVSSVVFSPDGKTLTSGSHDKTIILWDLTNPGTKPNVLLGHELRVNSVAISPDGRTLASGSGDKTIRLWNLTNFSAPPIVLHEFPGNIQLVAFSPNGKLLAACGAYPLRGFGLWDLTNHSAQPIIKRVFGSWVHFFKQGFRSWINSVAFSPDSKILASGSSYDGVLLWNLADLSDRPPIDLPYDTEVRSVAFSPDGRTLAAAGKDGIIRLWDPANSQAQPTDLRGHESRINTLAFSPVGKNLASGSKDRTVRVWNLTNLSAQPTILHGHEGWIWSVAYSPDGRILASGSDDSKVRLWNLASPSAKPTALRGHQDLVWATAFSPDGKTLASGGDDGTVRLWDLTPFGTQPAVLRGHGGWIRSVAFSPDGKTLATGSKDSSIRLWDLTNPSAEPKVLLGHQDLVSSVAFSPDGKILASGSWDKTVRLWAPGNPTVSPTVLHGHQGYVNSVAFSSDGKILASGSSDNGIRLWDLANPSESQTILHGHDGNVYSVVFSPDGRILASGSADRTVRLWKWNTPDTPPVVLRGHENAVRMIAFSPDGRTLASAGADRTVRLWNWSDPDAPPVVLRGQKDEVNSVAFSPDGQFVASGGYDKAIFIWLTTEGLAETVCKKVWRNLTKDEWNEFVGADIPYQRTCPNLP